MRLRELHGRIISYLVAPILGWLCFVTAAHARSSSDIIKTYCSIDSGATLSSHPLPRRGFYFYKPVANTPWVVYSDAAETHSYLFNFETGEELSIPGGGDAVPTADGRYVTQPEPLTFYPLDDLLRSGNSRERPAAALVDSSVHDSYQSFGTLSLNPPITRVMTGRIGPFQIKDYREIRGSSGERRIQPIGDKPTPLCGGKLFSLPMMSKDGRQFAGYDLSQRWDQATMKIYDFNAKSGHCRPVLDLGLKTGKVDFSYDGDEIAFAMMGPVHEDDASAPSQAFFNEAYVYKRSTGELLKLADNNDHRRYFSFPTFRSDGKVLLLNMPHVVAAGDPFDPGNPVFKSHGERFDLIDIHRRGKNLCPVSKPTAAAPGGPCAGKAKEILRQWHSSNHWMAQGPGSYVSPSDQIGVWLERRLEPPGRITLVLIAPKSVTKAYLEEPLCKPIFNVHENPARERISGEYFLDKDLRSMLRQGGSGVIYAWSPKMPLSISSMAEASQAAARLGLKVTFLLDPHADIALARQVAEVRHIPSSALMRMESVELFYRGMLLHYPSVLVYSKGKIIGDYIPGSKSAQAYREIFSARLGQ